MVLLPETWPVEIVGLVVRQVAKDEDNKRREASLSACMHVSLPFYYAALKYRFANIKISIPLYQRNEKSIATFLTLLKTNPSLSKYIQSFVVLVDGTRQGHETAESCAPPKFAILSEIVEMISWAKIRALTIKSAHPRAPVDLRHLEWQGLLVALRCIPSIRVFYLEGIQELPRALIVGDPAKDALEELHLSNVSLQFHSPFHYPRRTSRTHPNFARWRHVLEAACTTPLLPLSGLQVLKVDNVLHFLSFLRLFERKTPLPPPTFPRLRSFTSSNDMSAYYHVPYEQQDEVKILDGALPSLESLTLIKEHPAAPPGLPRDQLDFTRFKNLRHLAITGWDCSSSTHQDNVYLQALCRLFSCVTTPTAIESLSLTFVRPPDLVPGLLQQSTQPEWSRLDRILDNGNFSSLQELTLKILYAFTVDMFILPRELGEARARIPRLLPLVSANQNISFHQHIGPLNEDYFDGLLWTRLMCF